MSHTDPNRQTTHYSGYDSQRRPKSVTYADGVSVLYTYDTGFKGKLAKIQVSGDDPQSITYQYDPRGNITTETRSWGGETVSLEFVIDDSGLILKSKDPLTGKWLDYRYDGLGRVTQISFPVNGTATPIVTDIQYTPSNLLTSYSLPPSHPNAS